MCQLSEINISFDLCALAGFLRWRGLDKDRRCSTGWPGLPQWLKPLAMSWLDGTAEAVPLRGLSEPCRVGEMQQPSKGNSNSQCGGPSRCTPVSKERSPGTPLRLRLTAKKTSNNNGEAKQIPYGNDRKKSKGKRTSKGTSDCVAKAGQVPGSFHCADVRLVRGRRLAEAAFTSPGRRAQARPGCAPPCSPGPRCATPPLAPPGSRRHSRGR